MYVVFAVRKMELTARINRMQLKLLELQQKESDLVSYGGNVQDGLITPYEAANSPASIFGRQQQFMGDALAAAGPEAQQAYNIWKANYDVAQANSNGQLMDSYDPQMMFNGFFKQSLEASAKEEQNNIKKIETEIALEKVMLETHIKAAEAELEKVEKAEDAGIKRSAPDFTTG